MTNPGFAFALTLAATISVAGSALSEAEVKTVVVSGETVVEIAPGLLAGYLAEGERVDSLVFVPAAPEAHSARQALDTAWAENMRALRDTPRWDMAIRDADLSFPAAVDAFTCVLGFEITEADTPALYLLMRRSLTDLGLATYSAKKAYQRERPFMVGNTPICTPAEEDSLRGDGSYPSGHTAVGWGWALMLAKLLPDRADAILARGRAYGESRTVCNVHWYSDVVAGRMVGAAAFARLQGNEAFVAAMEAAGGEVATQEARALTPDNECALEAATLKEIP